MHWSPASETRLGEGARPRVYGHHHRVSYELACNWKIHVDNYRGGLPRSRAPFLPSNRLLDYRSYRTELAEWHSLQWSPLKAAMISTATVMRCTIGCGRNTMLNILPGRLQTRPLRAAWFHFY